VVWGIFKNFSDMIESIRISLIITAIYVCCMDGMIFQELRRFVQNALDRFLGLKWSAIVQKPLFTCMICMGSFWGFAGCLALGVPASEWVLTIFQVCGLNIIILSIIETVFK
jgi:hypothetical protein